MTERKARATAKECKDKSNDREMQKQQQIPGGNHRKKSKGKSSNKGMQKQEQTPCFAQQSFA
jgi:hypothetical protein